MNTQQVIDATLVSVRAQMLRSNTTHASQNLIVRHATHHGANAQPGILREVCEAVRDRLNYERAITGIDAKACAHLVAGLRRSMSA